MRDGLAPVLDLTRRLPRCCPHCDAVVSAHELWRHVEVCEVLAARRAGVPNPTLEGA